MGIIDRGTNIIEIKPVTQCNLLCKYCFVSAGDYCQNFMLDLDYLLEGVSKLASLKGAHDLEIHIAPYGEALLYPPLIEFIKRATQIPGISTISMQSNGLLLNEKKVDELARAGLSRLNISVNTFNEQLATKLAAISSYNVNHLLKMFDYILASPIDLLLAPVWFPKVNDEGIVDIIKYVKEKRRNGASDKKLRLGIQKYLTYRTGRRLGKIRPKTWFYFYEQLRQLEKLHDIKLILSPADFGIHPRTYFNAPFNEGDKKLAEIVMPGRFQNEWIGRINEDWAVKILSKQRYKGGERVPIVIEKSRPRESLLTGIAQK